MSKKLPKIFVQIASYRDPECQWTVKDLFEKAAHPERVNVGICWQVSMPEDSDCFRVPYPYPKQVRVNLVDAKDSKGANWARKIAQSLTKDEKYTLQIDAHMRFIDSWDEILISQLEKCDSQKPVLSTYPPPYTLPNNYDDGYLMRMCYSAFSVEANDIDSPILLYSSCEISPENIPENPFPAATISGGFIFSITALFEEVNIDPYIYFYGDELSYTVRLWTHGWDIFSPTRVILYHLWDRSTRKGHWDDHANHENLGKITRTRVTHIVGSKKTRNEEALTEIAKYGLGTVRTIEEFQEFAGVNFKNRTISEHAKIGIFGEDKMIQSSNKKMQLTHDWQKWLKENIEMGCAHKDIKKVMAENGFPEKIISDAIESYSAPTKKKPPLPKTSSKHKPKKVYEGPEGIIYDDFLPEDEYQKLYEFCLTTKYQYINTTDTSLAWHINDGFPLRSKLNAFYYPTENENSGADWVYPTETEFDIILERLLKINPEVKHVIGEPNKDWKSLSATSWLYPKDTSLSLHDDGAGVYSGAYTFYLNPEWQTNWGGLLLLMDPESNKLAKERKNKIDQVGFYKKQWLDESSLDSLMWENGFAKCVLPKRNRMVFIANDAYHMITKVTSDAGDRVRMSIAGFFDKSK